MSLRNHETQLNIWLCAQSVYYFLIGCGLYRYQVVLPENFMLGFGLMALGAVALCLYAVRIDTQIQRRRTYAGLVQFQIKGLVFFVLGFLVLICSLLEILLQFGGALAGIFTFFFARELQLSVTNILVRRFPAEYPEK